MTKFAAYDEIAIYAIADSPGAAIAKARDDARDPDAIFETAKIPNGLAEQIERDGWDGNRQMFEVVNGYVIEVTNV